MPGNHTSRCHKEHNVYPYLLRNTTIERANQVWTTDITYIPMAKGFMYLTAVMEVHSRYVLNWSISNSMDAEWCAQVVREAIEHYREPQIINTDQGSQYTSDVFTAMVLHEDRNIKLSMDGKGRATDNAFIESLWKTVKYAKLYLNPPENGLDLDDYFTYYNDQRRHTQLQDETPGQVYRRAA